MAGMAWVFASFVLPRPQGDLPHEVACRLTEIVEPRCAPVDRMQPCHDLTHRRIDFASFGRRNSGEGRIAKYAAFRKIHHIKGGADHRRVFAQKARRYHRDAAVAQRIHDAILALDHMRRRQQLARRLFAQNVTPVAALQQKRRIGLAAAELANGQAGGKSVDMGRGVRGKATCVELMSRTDVGHVGRTHKKALPAQARDPISGRTPAKFCPIIRLLNCRTKCESV
jgi:hypothetical protein